MGHLFAPFLAFDRLVQRGVDATAFFLMRHGVPKSRIYFVFMAVAVICVTGITAELLREGRGLSASFFALLTFFLLLVMYADLKDARKSEEAGHMYSKADDRRRGSVFKALWWVLLLTNVIEASRDGIDFKLAMNLGLKVSFVLLYYLANTPNFPPAQKDTVLEPAQDAA